MKTDCTWLLSIPDAIRFRNITLHISADGTARFSRRKEQVARAA